MGKHKGNGFNLFESYLASGLCSPSATTSNTEYVPLPEFMRASTLLEQIGKEYNWSDQQINDDIITLESNRLYYIRDLRELSKSSWKAIPLLPIVKDLLRKALRNPNAEVNNQKQIINDKMERKKQKKEDKKERKERKKERKRLGKPVINGKYGSPTEEKPSLFFQEGVISEDPETIKNTLQNTTIDNIIEPSTTATISNERKKSVSFSEEDPVTVSMPNEYKLLGNNNKGSNSSSSSSSSSSESEGEIEKTSAITTITSKKNTPKVFTGRPIKAVSGNRIRVRTNDGDIFEADRFCPHKKVDLVTWGQVMGRTLICTKHNWNFSLDNSSGFGRKGRSLNACQVNDW